MMNTKNINRFNFLLATFIILWGAWVRLSGSGAGCGEHWPLCNGEVIPMTDSYKTIIEFVHRLTSGIYGLTVLGGVIYAAKEYGKKHRVFYSSLLVLIFTIIEALIVAVLVKKGLVDKNASHLRAIVIAMHLANTLLLISTHLLVEYFTTTNFKINFKKLLTVKNLSILFLFMIVACSGAVTALGNTLFPDTSLIEGMGRDFDISSPFLIQLRIYHPIAAIALGLLIISKSLKVDKTSSTYHRLLLPTIVIALCFGVINWLMMSPAWGALIHLLLADALWSILLMTILYDSKK